MKKVSILLAGCLATIMMACSPKAELKPIVSGEIWPDDKGVHVNAHGGGVIYHDGTYYWYGEMPWWESCATLLPTSLLGRTKALPFRWK